MITKELIEMAKFTDIDSLNLGFKKEGNHYRSLEHDSLIFKKSVEEFWMYTWNSRGLQGDLIHFIMHYYNVDFASAIEFLANQKIVKKNDDTSRQRVPSTKDKFIFPDISKDMRRAFAYLIKTRLINPIIAQNLAKDKKICQDTKGNIVFPWYYRGKIVGAELQGTLTDVRFKGVAPNSAYAFGYTLKIGKPTKVLFFESAIDLLSYYTLNIDLNDVLMVSMSGLKAEVINNYKSLCKGLELVLAIDNDAAADNFIKQNNLENLKRFIPNCKDWNDDLKALNT